MGFSIVFQNYVSVQWIAFSFALKCLISWPNYVMSHPIDLNEDSQRPHLSGFFFYYVLYINSFSPVVCLTFGLCRVTSGCTKMYSFIARVLQWDVEPSCSPLTPLLGSNWWRLRFWAFRRCCLWVNQLVWCVPAIRRTWVVSRSVPCDFVLSAKLLVIYRFEGTWGRRHARRVVFYVKFCPVSSSWGILWEKHKNVYKNLRFFSFFEWVGKGLE